MASSEAGERSLEYSPTWALAIVATVFVTVSYIVERLLHWLGHFLHKTKRKALFAALVKIKDELMLVGFISLAMALLQTPISKICIKSSLYDKWTPCSLDERVSGQGRRRLLAAGEGVGGCPAGQEPFISSSGLHQLHIFIFILAAVHVFYSCVTMLLALLKVHSWKKWEREAQQAAQDLNLDDIVNSITFTRKSSFQKYHTSMCCSSNTIVVWVVCFFQQMYIPRADYITLRQGFTSNHSLRDDYNFDKYMVRCMEDEFQKIVGISAKLWAFVILFLLFNIHGVYLYFWSSFIPVIFVLLIGAKLQYVVATLALEAANVPGAYVGHVLRPRDELFWFDRPELLLSFLHLVLFQNSFELATFLWQVWTFGFHSCLLEENKTFVYVRLAMGLGVQLFCSVSTLPLYALVSQMGSNYKQSVLPPSVGRALHTWHKGAKKRVKMSFSFSKKRSSPTFEEQSLRDANDPNSLSPPEHFVMEDIPIESEPDSGPSLGKKKSQKQKGVDRQHSVYVQIDSSERKSNADDRG
ncbi:hypothetical protein M758_8G176400 [Ceratodon purpureus]|nr:hypothetical protein M758_8G176400 [Ceratodon purpureus]